MRNKKDYGLFSKNEKVKNLIILNWVDDLVIAAISLEDKEELKKTLKTKFKMEVRGNLEWFLGMQVSEHSKEITLGSSRTLIVSSKSFAYRIAKH